MLSSSRSWNEVFPFRDVWREYLYPPRRSAQAERAFQQDVRSVERVILVQLGLLGLALVLVLFPADFWLYEGEVLAAFIRWRLFVTGTIVVGLAGAWWSDVLWEYVPEWFVGVFGVSIVGVTYFLGRTSLELTGGWQKPLHLTWTYLMPMFSAFCLSARFVKRVLINLAVIGCIVTGFFVLNPQNVHGGAMTTVLMVLVAAMLLALLGGHLIHNLYRKSFFLNRDLEREQKRSEELLLNILPESVADRLKYSNRLVADGFDEVTVLFTDIVEFTPVADELEPSSVVLLLDDMFSAIDGLIREYPVEKIKTVGDEYFLVSGVPEDVEDHARVAGELALEIREEVQRYRKGDGQSFDVRIGMHTGPVVAGVIGMDKFVYDVWGDTVNVGSRMEARSEAGKIQVTDSTRRAVQAQSAAGEFTFRERGTLTVKGKGKMTTYFLEPADPNDRDTSSS